MKLLMVSTISTFLTLSLAAVAEARLGDNQAAAEVFANQQGAISPFIQVNTKGKVDYESWQAPPEMWTRAQADRVRKLLTGGKKPVRTYKDGGLTIFIYKDKSQAAYSTLDGMVISVKAKAAGSTAHF